MRHSKLLFTLILGLLPLLTFAQDSKDLAKSSQNPVADMYSVPLEYWHHDGSGPQNNGSADLFIARPGIPVELGKVNLINRFILPYSKISVADGGGSLGETYIPPPGEADSGLGNFQYQAILSPSAPGSLIYGAGLMVEFPTHTGNLGSDAYSAGPVVLLVGMPGNWVFGTLVQGLWSLNESDPNDEVSKLIWQYFVNYNFGNGWYATTTPIMTADWNAASGQQWTVPIGGGVGKLMKFESFPPLDFKLQAFSNVVKPDNGPDWQMMFSVKLILPKQLFNGGMPK